MQLFLIQASIALKKKPEENDRETRSDIFKAAFFQEIISKVQGKSIRLSLVSGGGTEDGYAYAFASNWLDDPGSLELKIKDRSANRLKEINLEVLIKD
ncbi:hypothetical protein A3842_06990 [Paenibacillus sp. P3E]|uniref:hypothetical protein n=1 Tax=Paenibacillus sp. P3E TaxID=1349435 RepID=UPI00093A8C05|nr:hypothetical protein [Paenibacillus sp. P3E]OKP86135.1 hypothetical protein A3842_06990 [Paenibacillus sp. P3E]